jgi:glycine cleavage system H lipoate-binding protein
MILSLNRKIQPECLWMQAGVVKKKECNKEFACSTCVFDKALTRACRKNQILKEKGLLARGKRAELTFWTDRLLNMPISGRPCVHYMKGHIGFKNCLRSYHCIDCEFEQYFYDQFKVHTVIQPIEYNDINGVSLPAGYYLHPGHTWIKIEEQGMVRIGIDDFASRLFGKFDTLSPLLIGEQLQQDKPAFTLLRGRHKVRFLSPVNGVVSEVNNSIVNDPGLINNSPYTDGWIMLLYCPTLKKDLKQLMFMDSGKGFMGKEVCRLYEFLETETGLKAADGGELVSDIFGNLPGVPWETLLEKFIPRTL